MSNHENDRYIDIYHPHGYSIYIGKCEKVKI